MGLGDTRSRALKRQLLSLDRSVGLGFTLLAALGSGCEFPGSSSPITIVSKNASQPQLSNPASGNPPPAVTTTTRPSVAVTTTSARPTTTTARPTTTTASQPGGGGGPVPPGAAGPGPNEPSGYTSMGTPNPFNALPPDYSAVDDSGSTKFYGENNLSILNDGTSPASAPNFLRLLFPAGHPGGGQPNGFAIFTRSPVATYSAIYTRVWIRVSANWTDNGNAGTKFFFFDQAQGNNHYVGLTEQGTFRLGVNLQSPFAYASPRPNNSGASSTKGVWHDVEILITANTPGAYNGVARVWVDGAIVVNASDVGYFGPGQTPLFSLPEGPGFWLAPTYGGGFNPVPADQSLDIDHWYASVRP